MKFTHFTQKLFSASQIVLQICVFLPTASMSGHHEYFQQVIASSHILSDEFGSTNHLNQKLVVPAAILLDAEGQNPSDETPNMWSKNYIGLYCQYAAVGLLYGSAGTVYPLCFYVYKGESNLCANASGIVFFAWNIKILFAILTDTIRLTPTTFIFLCSFADNIFLQTFWFAPQAVDALRLVRSIDLTTIFGDCSS